MLHRHRQDCVIFGAKMAEIMRMSGYINRVRPIFRAFCGYATERHLDSGARMK
jgi:hypothetical protein